MRLPLIGGFIATVLLLMTVGAAQAPKPDLRVAFPTDDSHDAIGPIVISAFLDPPSTPVERMQFLVDNVLVCTVERMPFVCPFNAGDPPGKDHVFRIVAYLRGGQKITSPIVRTKKLDFSDNADVPIKHITVSVLDGSRYVRGLTKNAFHLFEDDVEKPITYFPPPGKDAPLELVLAVDISDSMKDSIREVKENVKRFRSALKPTDRVTIVGFNENFFTVAPASMSEDLPGQLKRIDRLRAWGMTSLYEILIQSFNLLGRKQQSRLAIVAFTDGDDTASRIPREAVERRKETSDAVLYLIGQGNALKSRDLMALCERLAKNSGGGAYFPRTMDGLREAFDEILEALSNQYLLGFEPKTDTALHRLRITVDGHHEVRHMTSYRWKAEGPQ